jgi:hypothetical protein
MEQQKAIHSQSYKKWTLEEDNQLHEEFRQHLSPKQMSQIHQRNL